MNRQKWIAAWVCVGVVSVGVLTAAASEPEQREAPTTQPTQQKEAYSPQSPCCAVDEVASPSADADQSADSYTSGDADASAGGSRQEEASPSTEDEPTTTELARAGQWVEADDREAFDLEYDATNQGGVAISLTELAGRPTVMSFIFTRCPMPKMCPLITVRMAQLQQGLKEAGLDERVNLVLMTYDPVFDTPEPLERYGTDRGLVFNDRVMMLRPGVERFRELLHEFQVGVNYQSDGSISHFIELLLIDHEGRFVRDYQGQVWENTPVLDDLKRLVAQQQAGQQVMVE